MLSLSRGMRQITMIIAVWGGLTAGIFAATAGGATVLPVKPSQCTIGGEMGGVIEASAETTDSNWLLGSVDVARLVLPVTASGVAGKDGTSSPCPNDMADMGGYCVDKQPSPSMANWYTAADMCQARGTRLCSNEEWLQACDAAPINAVAAMPGLEWLGNWAFETSDQVFDALEHGYFRCRTSSQPRPPSRPFEVKKFRCCR